MRFQKVKSQSKRKEETMGLFTGVDLHSNNGYYGIINEDEERIFKKKLPNHLPTVLSNLEPFREIRG